MSKQLERIFKEREAVHASAGEKKYVAVIDERIQEYEDEIIHPILCGGDVIGAVILLEKKKNLERQKKNSPHAQLIFLEDKWNNRSIKPFGQS